MVGLPQTQINFSVVNDVRMDWLELNMDNVEQGRPIEPFIRHRRESQGYAKVKNDESRWGPEYSIQRVDNRTELD